MQCKTMPQRPEHHTVCTQLFPIPTYSAAKPTLTRLTLSAMQTCSAHVYGFHCIGLVWMLVTAISHNNLKGRVD